MPLMAMSRTSPALTTWQMYVVVSGLPQTPDSMAALSVFLALSRYVSRTWRHRHSAAKPLLTVGADVGSVVEGVSGVVMWASLY